MDVGIVVVVQQGQGQIRVLNSSHAESVGIVVQQGQANNSSNNGCGDCGAARAGSDQGL